MLAPPVAELLPRFRLWQQEVEDERKLAEIIIEGVEVEHEAGMPLRRSADGHARARGLPIVGRISGGGASPGTDRLAALLAKEARRARRL
jgi:hypothetical protein